MGMIVFQMKLLSQLSIDGFNQAAGILKGLMESGRQLQSLVASRQGQQFNTPPDKQISRDSSINIGFIPQHTQPLFKFCLTAECCNSSM
jgi:hypothetical protein